MLKQNIKLFFRNIKKNKNTFLINIIGLSTGLACVLLIALWVTDELGFDKFHKNDDSLYQIMEVQNNANELEVTEATPGLLAETMADEIPGVEYATAVSWNSDFTVINKEKRWKESGIAAGNDFFNLFSFPLLHGDKNQVLAGTNNIVLSKELADKIFGTDVNCVGKTIVLQGEQKDQFLITGTFDNIPSNSSLQFDFILPFNKYKEWQPWLLGWGNNGVNTYVKLNNGANKSEFDTQIVDFVKDNGGEKQVTLFSKQFSEKYLYGDYENGKLVGGRIEYVRLFSIIALFILLIACVNFMNLSTANATRRLREIGVKKAMGSDRKSLVSQYLGESLLTTFLSLLVCVGLMALALPKFNAITGKELTLHFSLGQIAVVLMVALFTGLLAGSYPALYLSRFTALGILKGKIKDSIGELWVRKGLVVFQFAIIVILLVSVWVVYQQIAFVQNQNLGFDKDNIVQFEKLGNLETNTDYFIAEAKKLPGVLGVSSINHSLAEGGYSSSSSTVEWEGKDPDAVVEMESVMVDKDMLEMLEIDMADGRRFSEKYNDYGSKIIFNEAAIATMGLENPVGKCIRLWDEEREIIGVAKDFHFQSFRENVRPLFFLLRPEGAWLMMVKLEAGKEKTALAALEKFYKDFNPGYTLDYKFIDADIEAQYQSEKRVAALSQYFAGLAVLISCLGLFGLASFTAERRKKEIGIRKVLGQTVTQVTVMLSGEFAKLVLVAIVIALPIAYILTSNWLSGFAYRIQMTVWYFLGAGALALLVAMLTVGSQAMRAANKSPVNALRDE